MSISYTRESVQYRTLGHRSSHVLRRSPFRMWRISRCRLSKYLEKTWLINNPAEWLEQRYLLCAPPSRSPTSSYFFFTSTSEQCVVRNSMFRGQKFCTWGTGAGSHRVSHCALRNGAAVFSRGKTDARWAR